MINDQDIERAAAQLQSFQVESDQHTKNHASVLQHYAQLIEDYKRLKSDYEEERESREKYKQLARGSERNPFVLVLVDGDGIIFDDDLVSNGAEGGSRAAQLLHDAVRSSLVGRELDHCRVMVRVYANLAGLSRALSKSKLAGPEKRSLGPFVANFNRSHELFDFVDAGELKENADSKIRAVFRQFVDNAQCKHIFFAACHDVGYINELTPYASSRDRITLVRTYCFHSEFLKLGLRVEDFPNVFRNAPLRMDSSAYLKPMVSAPPSQPSSTSHSTPSGEMGAVCFFHQKGLCRYGKTCKNLHVKANNGHFASNIDASPNKFRTTPLARTDHEFVNGTPHLARSSSEDLASQLPREDELPPNVIPVNKALHRLDPLLPAASHAEKAAFKRRTTSRKICNDFHLIGECPSGDDCEYDHSPITYGMLNCLKHMARNIACTRRGACRSSTCHHGHICQKADCTRRGGKAICRLPPTAHIVDLQVYEYQKATTPSSAHTDKRDCVDEDYLSPFHGSDSGDQLEGAALHPDQIILFS